MIISVVTPGYLDDVCKQYPNHKILDADMAAKTWLVGNKVLTYTQVPPQNLIKSVKKRLGKKFCETYLEAFINNRVEQHVIIKGSYSKADLVV